MDHREKILQLVKEKGPLLPGQINKELKTNVLFASAMLSEMVDQKKLRISTIKVGGSPLYYVDGQENKLTEYADKLDENGLKVFELLKSSKVLRDRDYDPQSRVSLREIKDFAVPLEVTANGEKDLFWKYFLITDDDAKERIKEYINERKEPKETTDITTEEPDETEPVEEEKPEETTEEPLKEKIAEPKKQNTEKPVTDVKMTTLEEAKIPEFSYQTAVSFSTLIDTDDKISIEEKQEKKSKTEFPEDDQFFDKIKDFMDENKINIKEFELIRKGSEYDFTVTINSFAGELFYFCKVKTKAKINDADISAAFVQGQLKRLPVLYLSTGEITGKAQELIETDLKCVTFKKIGD